MVDGIRKHVGQLDAARAGAARKDAVGVAKIAAGEANDGGAPAAGVLATFTRFGIATEAPVDTERTSAIRRAIAEGRYPIDYERLAERMMDLDLGLRSAGR